jgi:uncharacterized protein (DUF885 family)
MILSGGQHEANAVDRAYRAKLAAISTEAFPEQDRISHDLLLHVLDNRITNYELKTYEMPLSQMQGIHKQPGRSSELRAA